MKMNQLFKVNLHRRGGLNPPECIHRYTIGMLSGRFNLPLQWTARLFIPVPLKTNSANSFVHYKAAAGLRDNTSSIIPYSFASWAVIQ